MKTIYYVEHHIEHEGSYTQGNAFVNKHKAQEYCDSLTDRLTPRRKQHESYNVEEMQLDDEEPFAAKPCKYCGEQH